MAEVGARINYDLHPDGKRIMAVMPAGSSGESKESNYVTILLNFFDELKRKVPAGK